MCAIHRAHGWLSAGGGGLRNIGVFWRRTCWTLRTLAPQQSELGTALFIEDGLLTSARSSGAASASGTSGGIISVLPHTAARDASDAGMSSTDGGSEHGAYERLEYPSSPQVLVVPGLTKSMLARQKMALK